MTEQLPEAIWLAAKMEILAQFGAPILAEEGLECAAELRRLNALNTELVTALEALCSEFRALDLPYGSEAYAGAYSVMAKVAGGSFVDPFLQTR